MLRPWNDFIWDNFRTLNGLTSYGSPTGYTNAIVSKNIVAFNAYAAPAKVSSKTGFDFFFNGAYFTGAWRNSLNVDVSGWVDGGMVQTKSFSVNSTGPTWMEFDWLIDELRFASSGGTIANFGGTEAHFAMDNFTYSEPTTIISVPEPGSLALLGLALSGLAVSRRSRRRP